MCGFTFTVFLSAFQLLPTAPYHILALGGSTLASGLFLGFLTYSSAFSAPATGALADRLGSRRILLISSLTLAGFNLLVCGHSRLPRHARARPRARCVLVRVALGVGVVSDRHAAGASARRRGRLLGAVVGGRGRGRSVGRILGLSIRLECPVRGCGGPQPGHGGDRVALAAAGDQVATQASTPIAAFSNGASCCCR